MAHAIGDWQADSPIYDRTNKGQTRAEREASAAAMQGGGVLSGQGKGFNIDAAGYLALVRRRELARVAWRAFFKNWDVLIGPMALDTAFEHQTVSRRPHDVALRAAAGTRMAGLRSAAGVLIKLLLEVEHHVPVVVAHRHDR